MVKLDGNKRALPAVFSVQSLGMTWSPSPRLLMCSGQLSLTTPFSPPGTAACSGSLCTSATLLMLFIRQSKHRGQVSVQCPCTGLCLQCWGNEHCYKVPLEGSGNKSRVAREGKGKVPGSLDRGCWISGELLPAREAALVS